jgi:hypothetical protein
MDIPADKCTHLQLTRMPGPIPLYRCSACSSGFVLNAYLPIPPGRFDDVARQFAGSERVWKRVQRDLQAAEAGLVLVPNGEIETEIEAET